MKDMQYVEEMGLLAELSYVDFSSESLSGISGINTNWETAAKHDIETAYKDSVDRATYVIDPLLDTYEIVDFVDHGALLEGNLSNGSGLQMLLLKDGNNYVIAYRGTGELVSLADAGVSSVTLFCIETDIYTNRAKFNKELTEQKVNYNRIKLIDSINKNYQQLFLAHLTDNNQNLTNEREVA